MSSVDLASLKAQTADRWPGIFHALGIEVPEVGKAGPCPICGGKDRFSIDRGRPDGGWFCRQCTPHAGDGFNLVQRALCCTFPEVLEKVMGVCGCVQAMPSKPMRDPREGLNAIWKASMPLVKGSLVMAYLQARGIKIWPENVRYCPECWNTEKRRNMPAMVARVMNREGVPVSIHRTYLDGDKKAQLEAPKKLMPATEKLHAVAVRLSPAGARLGIAEGIETALSAEMMFGFSVWAVISTTIMETFVPPEGVEELTIFADSDSNYAGEKAAYTLANRLAIKGLSVKVRVPDGWNDFNDQLMNRG